MIPDWYLERIEQSRPQLKQWMREQYGLELQSGPFGISSRKALIGAKVAEAHSEAAGVGYQRAVMRAYWLQARDISDVDVLAEIAETVGMNRDVFLRALDDPQYEALVQSDIEAAHRMGIGGVPAFIFERKYYLSGARPVDLLRQVIDQVAAEQR